MVLVCDSGGYSLWASSSLYKTRGRLHLRWSWWLGGGSHSSYNHRNVPCISLANQHLDTESDIHRNIVLDPYGNQCWCRHGHVFPSVSKRRSTLCGSHGAGRRCRTHGHLWHPFFQRVCIMAKVTWNCIFNRRSPSFAIFARKMNKPEQTVTADCFSSRCRRKLGSSSAMSILMVNSFHNPSSD